MQAADRGEKKVDAEDDDDGIGPFVVLSEHGINSWAQLGN